MQYHQLNNISNQYLALSENEKKRFELAGIDTFLFWSRLTWCNFLYMYCDNLMNRQLGRVGRIASYRTGTRNIDLVPTRFKPAGRNLNSRVIRYFDANRAGSIINSDGTSIGFIRPRITDFKVQSGQWRSFRRDTFVIIIEIYSPVTGKFESDFSKFYDKKQSAS
ncbi:hypothetical protein [Xanthocytophaga agilis]|uniref:Uncharacterized protein n=1 Tax=Xanthocytophaga agilis TaxID=3048010 RepID=A0AAE3UFJ6_9BACT|nr:hypothetical protein [Xanthocytophaga agilis]MDJ1500643.1 hypothetical protein [Xanthocytophaga agilis]